MSAPNRRRLAAVLLAAITAISVRAAADDGPRVFLDHATYGVRWRLSAQRWSGKGAEGARGDRLATARREAGGMVLEANVRRGLHTPRGKEDPLERARFITGAPAGDLGRHDLLKREGLRAAYAVRDFKDTSPPGRTFAVVLVRDADYIWLEASGPAKLLDDATIDELIDSIEVTGDPKPPPRKPGAR